MAQIRGIQCTRARRLRRGPLASARSSREVRRGIPATVGAAVPMASSTSSAEGRQRTWTSSGSWTSPTSGSPSSTPTGSRRAATTMLVRTSMRFGAMPSWKMVPGTARSSIVRSASGAPKCASARRTHGVLLRRSHPYVDVLRVAGLREEHDGVRADDDELSGLVAQRGQQTFEVGVDRHLHPGRRALRRPSPTPLRRPPPRLAPARIDDRTPRRPSRLHAGCGSRDSDLVACPAF